MGTKATGAAKKKVTSAKATTSETGTKYADKSAGQPELLLLFDKLKALLMPYAKGAIELAGGTNGQMSLTSKKQVTIAGRQRDKLWFAGLLIQKGYVGFYYMPIYTEPELKDILQPDLLKCLKGKGCFHIKKDNAQLNEQIADALQKGYQRWEENGWV